MVRVVTAGLILAVAATAAGGAQLRDPLPVNNYHLLLPETYPIETSVSFHASLLHWLDSLAGLSGAGLTAGKTQRVHRIEFSHVLGRPTDEDREVLLAFAHARLRYAAEHQEGDVNGLTRAFLEAETMARALDNASRLLPAEDLAALEAGLRHFVPHYLKIWRDGQVPKGFLHRAMKEKKRRSLSRFLIRVSEFYGVSPHQKPYPQIILMPVVDGAGTHAQAIGHHLLIEIRHWEGLIDECAPLVHENAHLLFHRMSPERFERLIEVASESSVGLTAWQTLKEALPTAIGQGLAYERFLPERWSMEQPWYHLDLVDRYAKRLYPLVKETFESGGTFDENFLRRAIAVYPDDDADRGIRGPE